MLWIGLVGLVTNPKRQYLSVSKYPRSHSNRASTGCIQTSTIRGVSTSPPTGPEGSTANVRHTQYYLGGFNVVAE